MAMVLVICITFHGLLSGYQVSLNYFNTFKDLLQTKQTDGRTDGREDKAATICSPFGEHKYVEEGGG